MSQSPLFPSLDGLMHLAKREGIDIRSTLLRVLTDLYVQSPSHSVEEERHYVELASRLIGEVDDATRSVVRNRLSIYKDTPAEIQTLLGLRKPVAQPSDATASSLSAALNEGDAAAEAPILSTLSMQPGDAASIDEMFMRAAASERVEILRNLEGSPLKPAPRIEPRRAGRAIAVLERAAFAQDHSAFAAELADILLLPATVAKRIVADASGEPLVCAAKALAMPGDVFERIVMFLKPEWGSSVLSVFRLARLYDSLSEHLALIMLAVWRGASVAQTKAKYSPSLHDDERRRARPASSVQPASGHQAAKPLPSRAKTGH
jgi:hypothetical protein